MRWTARKSSTRVKATGNIFGLKTIAHPPNSNDAGGLKLKILLNGRPWDEVHFFNGGVKPLYYYLPSIKNKDIEIRTEVSQTFNLYKMGVSNDDRDLGVAVSAITFPEIMPKDGVGFYDWEIWGGDHLPGWPKDKPINFRWTGKRATLNLRNKYFNGCRIYLKCAQPDIQQNPVHLIIDGIGKKIRELAVNDHLFRVVKLGAEKLKGIKVLTIHVSRTWNPKLASISETSLLTKADYRVNILKRIDFDLLNDNFDRHGSDLMEFSSVSSASSTSSRKQRSRGLTKGVRTFLKIALRARR